MKSRALKIINRFNGFDSATKPLKRFIDLVRLPTTQLKQGVNHKQFQDSDSTYIQFLGALVIALTFLSLSVMSHITIDPDICKGTPTIKETRIPLAKCP